MFAKSLAFLTFEKCSHYTMHNLDVNLFVYRMTDLIEFFTPLLSIFSTPLRPQGNAPAERFMNVSGKYYKQKKSRALSKSSSCGTARPFNAASLVFNTTKLTVITLAQTSQRQRNKFLKSYY